MTTESCITELEATRRTSLRNTDRDPNPSTTPPDDGLDDRQRILNSRWYIADHPESQALNARIGQVAAEFEVAFRKSQQTAQRVLAPVLGSFGKNSTVHPPIYLDYSGNVHIGDNVFINFGLTALDVVKVTICGHAQLGPNVQLLPPVHPLGTEARAAYLGSGNEIIIGRNAWIGGGAAILGGVHIGDNSVVATGAVVTKDVPAGTVAAGNPTKVIRLIEAWIRTASTDTHPQPARQRE